MSGEQAAANKQGGEAVDGAGRTRRVFRPKLWPSLIALVMLGILLSLGNWQARRYGETTAAHALYAEQHDTKPKVTDLGAVPGDGNDKARLTELQYRRGELRGTLEADKTQLLTARYMMGKRGYGVMMPMKVESGPHERILVHLGWAPMERLAEYLRSVAASPDRTVKGRLQVTSSAPEARPSGEMFGHPTWVRVHADAVAKRVEGLEPRLMLQAGEMAVGKAVDITRLPVDGYTHPVRIQPGKHIEYAMTWYGLSVTLVLVWAAFSLRKVPVVARVDGVRDAA